MKNKKGFTLIELLAVIVILGILMLIAIPAVTKYIDSSKKETYVKTLNSMVDVVRYGVISGDSKYDMSNASEKNFSLKNIELEKGSNKSPYGDFIDASSYIKVIKNNVNGQYEYKVQARDVGGYCIELTDINALTKDSVVKCDNSVTYETYSIGDEITFAGSNWYVIKNSSSDEDYVTLMSASVRTISSFGDSSSYDSSAVKNILEGYANSTLGSDNLREINGYKIRLITMDELQQNLGYSTSMTASWYEYSQENTPLWVYSYSASNMGYWTMTVDPENTDAMLCVVSNGRLEYCSINSGPREIRPVINLLKSSINTN